MQPFVLLLAMTLPAAFAQGDYEVAGSGANIWGPADAFHFIWKEMPGDVARVRFVGTGKVAHRKAGIPVRQTLEGGAAWAGVMLYGNGLASLQYREAALTKEMRSAGSAPAILRLVRKGEPLAGAGSMTVALTDPASEGLGVCAHDDTVTEKAVFPEVEWSH